MAARHGEAARDLHLTRELPPAQRGRPAVRLCSQALFNYVLAMLVGVEASEISQLARAADSLMCVSSTARQPGGVLGGALGGSSAGGTPSALSRTSLTFDRGRRASGADMLRVSEAELMVEASAKMEGSALQDDFDCWNPLGRSLMAHRGALARRPRKAVKSFGSVRAGLCARGTNPSSRELGEGGVMASIDNPESPNGHRHLLTLAPNPDISGPTPGPIAQLAYRLVDALKSVGYWVDTELWGRHQREEGPVQKVLGRAADLVRIRRRIGRGSYDLVFVNTCHDWLSLVRDLLLVHLSPASTRWVLLFHGSRSDWLVRPGRRLFKLATRCLLPRTAAVLLLSSEEVMEWSRFYPRGNFYLVANAFVPMNREESRSSQVARSLGPPELLFAGRLVRDKGIYELLEAFATVRSRRVCHLTVVGEGPEAEQLRTRALQLGVAGDVELTGHVPQDELFRAYGRADVFVLPTYREGLPTVLLEAMSFGLPIVTTRLRGAADYLIEGENVLFVPPQVPDALAEALCRLLDDDGLRSVLGENNLRRVEDFAPARVVGAYERVFDDVLGRV